MATIIEPISWKGNYVFRLSGSGLHEDTLRVKSSAQKQEQFLRLILPTLCITYADAKFQDSIGGEQVNYPASQVYGPLYFDPPVEIIGEQEIERLTYIRGAQRVEIGPKDTAIAFPSWKELVIPRLRIDQKDAATANLQIPETLINVDDPLKITARQYADGRHVGGVRFEKRHPKWQPPSEKETYSLWIRVIDGVSLKPIPEMMIDILHWDAKMRTSHGNGGFRLDDRLYTDGTGCIQVPNRPSGELEAYVVRRPGWRVVVRCLRPLAGQKVRLHMRAWLLKQDTMRIKWQGSEKLNVVAQRTGHSVEDILKLNQFKGTVVPKAGMRINLPCYMARYQLEPWDTLDWVGKTFGYGDAKGLAEVNGLKDVTDLDGSIEINLPDWRFFYAQEGDTLASFDTLFGLPPGSSITVGRVFHPDPGLPYAGETVAVPTPLFAEKTKKG
jgi:hypothetical protein